MDARAWLELADNAEVWARLRRALDLGTGFSLLFVVVANVEAEALAVDALQGLAVEVERDPVLLDARGVDADAPVRRLLGQTGEHPLVLLCTLASASVDREAFERCFVQLNILRDQIAARLTGPLVAFVRRDALRWLINVAPDLFSVHTTQFHLSSPHDAGQPAWLMLPHEAFGLLGVGEAFTAPSIDGMPTYLEPIPEVPNPLLGREAELGWLRAAMARSPGKIRVWGARGIGKSSVIAAVVREFENHYERVLWIHGWAAHTVSAVLGAIVRALDERGRCPADPIDIEARYRELTRARRVLIVVNLVGDAAWGLDSVELPAPASGSLLIEEACVASASADEVHVIGPLPNEHAIAPWEQRTDEPNVPYTITAWSCFATAIPVRFLDADLAELEGSGVLHLDGDSAHLAGPPDEFFDYGERAKFLEALERTTSPLTPAELEFSGRGLRLYTREWGKVDDEFWAHESWTKEWRAASETLALRAFASLPTDERAAFAAALAVFRSPDEAFLWTRRAIAAAIASAQILRARRLLSDADETLTRGQLDPVWLANAKLALALIPPAELRDAAIALLLFESESMLARAHPVAATLARVRYGLSHDGDLEPLPIRALIEILAADAVLPAKFDELAKATAHPDLYPHFVHAHQCILALRRADWREAKRHLDLTTDTAQAWGLAVPLLRAHLLALEYALATGDLEPATIDLDATLTRCDQVFGPLHLGTLAALTLALHIRNGLGQIDAARSLADDCRRRLRYINPDATTLARLLKFYEQHGPADVAAGLRARMS